MGVAAINNILSKFIKINFKLTFFIRLEEMINDCLTLISLNSSQNVVTMVQLIAVILKII